MMELKTEQALCDVLMNFAVMSLVIVLCVEQSAHAADGPHDRLYAINLIKAALGPIEKAYESICPTLKGESHSQVEDKRPLEIDEDKRLAVEASATKRVKRELY